MKIIKHFNNIAVFIMTIAVNAPTNTPVSTTSPPTTTEQQTNSGRKEKIKGSKLTG